MAQVTTKGREIALKVLDHIECDGKHEIWLQVKETCSLIARHAVTLRRYEEMFCGDGIHDGDWVNKHHAALEKKYSQLARRIDQLVDSLPLSFRGKIGARVGGDPRGWVVALLIPTAHTTSDGETIHDQIGIE